MINIKDMLKALNLDSLNELTDMPESFRKELAKIDVDGEAGGGLVVVQGTGQGRVRAINIDASLIPDEQVRHTIADLLVAAFNVMCDKAENKREALKSEKIMELMPDFVRKDDV